MSDEEGAYDDEEDAEALEEFDESADDAPEAGTSAVMLAAQDDSGGEASSDEEAGEGSEEEAEPGTEARQPTTATATAARADPLLRAANRSREVILVPPDDRCTDNRLALSEVAQIVAMRAEQIARSATTFCPSRHVDPTERAMEELQMRRCPLKLRRMVDSSELQVTYEEWDVNEMALPLLP